MRCITTVQIKTSAEHGRVALVAVSLSQVDLQARHWQSMIECLRLNLTTRYNNYTPAPSDVKSWLSCPGVMLKLWQRPVRGSVQLNTERWYAAFATTPVAFT
jgi:hypothetical protein